MSEGKKKRNVSIQNKSSGSKQKKIRVAVGETWDGVEALAPEPRKKEPTLPDGQQQKSIVMMVSVFSSVLLVFLLYLFAFVTKNANMMSQIMTIAQIALGSGLTWAGVRTGQKVGKPK